MESKRVIAELPNRDIGIADAKSMREADAIVTDDPIVRAAVLRDMRVPVFEDMDAAMAWHRQTKLREMKVSAIVPNYNYAKYLPEALDSLAKQTVQPDEIIVVDDASTDDSYEVASDWASNSPIHTRVLRHVKNTGNVGGPRNTGIALAKNELIVCLDSDDMIEPKYLEELTPAFARSHVGIAYGGVQTIDEGYDNLRTIHHNFPPAFDWGWMMQQTSPPRTCIPVASMFRKSRWERVGGYDENRVAAEDVDFWCRVIGIGGEPVKATADPVFVYRRHGPSMSGRPIPDIGLWSNIHRGFNPLAAPTNAAPVLRDYTKPTVSVIIPVGSKHVNTLPSAIHSLLAQSFWNWEAVVVNAAGQELPLLPYPFVTEVVVPEGTPAGQARNEGVRVAKGTFVLFLDADDYLTPDALDKFIKRYAQGDAGYIYSGWWIVKNNKAEQRTGSPRPYDPYIWLTTNTDGLHAVTVLMPREVFLGLGGFDSSIDLFEDWAFFAKCAALGVHGKYVEDPLLCYRVDTGQRRTDAQANRGAIADYLMRNFGDYIERRKEPMGCCGQQTKAVEAAAAAGDKVALALQIPGAKLMKYEKVDGGVRFFGLYEGGKTVEPIWVPNGDWQRLAELGWVEVVTTSVPDAPVPAAIKPSSVKVTEAS